MFQHLPLKTYCIHFQGDKNIVDRHKVNLKNPTANAGRHPLLGKTCGPPSLKLVVQYLAKFHSQATMVRDEALPKSFAGSNILLPANLGDSLEQQLKTM